MAFEVNVVCRRVQRVVEPKSKVLFDELLDWIEQYYCIAADNCVVSVLFSDIVVLSAVSWEGKHRKHTHNNTEKKKFEFLPPTPRK
jgi:hypothetical protein